MEKTVELPTDFAKTVLASVELYYEHGEEELKKLGITSDQTQKEEFEFWAHMHSRLENFQQMAMACDFDDAMIAYHGMDDMSERQLELLRIVHKSTRHWMIGAVTQEVISKLSSPKIANKDFAQLVVLVFQNLTQGGGQQSEAELLGKIEGSLNIYHPDPKKDIERESA